MRHDHEREIDGQTWKTNEFPATVGLRLFVGLAKLLGGPVGKAVAALRGDGLDAGVGVLGDALESLTGRLDEEQALTLAKRLLANTTVIDEGGKLRDAAGQFDLLFQGRYLTLFKVLWFVVEANFKIPLSGFLAAGASQVNADETGKQ